jgi:hypothetical protein
VAAQRGDELRGAIVRFLADGSVPADEKLAAGVVARARSCFVDERGLLCVAPASKTARGSGESAVIMVPM